MPRVSIYIPAYNAGRFVGEAIRSAARQGLDDVEILVADDGSTDHTADVCRRFGNSVDGVPFRWFANATNLGGGATRNRCIAAATGDYLFNLDADNILPDGLVASLLARAEEIFRERDERVMVSPMLIQYFEDVPRRPLRLRFRSRRVLRHNWTLNRLDFKFVLTSPQSPASGGQYLFHRSVTEATGGFFEDCGPFDTWSFGVRAYVAGFRYVSVPDTHYLHRLHGDSYWTKNQVSGMNREYLFCAIRHFTELYAPETLETLSPDNTAYPEAPFTALRLRELDVSSR